MKKIILLIVYSIIFITHQVVAQNPTNSKTLVKSFNISGVERIITDFSVPVTVKTWSEPVARIEINITLTNNNSEALLKSLIAAGRYNITSNKDNNNLVLSAPSVAKSIKINGQELKEQISYTLLVPAEISVASKQLSLNTDNQQ